ncbi:leucine-rich repeat-containing protein 49 isoform X5 [Ascaphus truei]|uniref:leucine-rich repeat-containing protein 49 isoform X5 n=1 Tax=Ascaphus truei TaxID=8439 RepID=UPI003F5AA48F
MLPGKYRGRLVPTAVNNSGLHLVLQTSPVTDRNKQFEFRLSKEAASLHNRNAQHDSEKNTSGRQDGRLSSPVTRNKQSYIPLTTNVTEVFGSSPKQHGRETMSVGPFGDLPGHIATKSRLKPSSHCASPNNNHEDANQLKDHFSFMRNVSRSEPGCPVVHRTAEEKAISPDMLNLERQKFAVCPIIKGEDQLRLLYFQHNFITKIHNLSSLQRLIFLDLYDNQIEEISGLSSLRSLRVLMLGKNRIQKISNLENLTNLDVLDLHGNQITKIVNVGHLGDLRVLNLARNLISQVENLNGLDSLTELNLRHNKINVVEEERRTASVLARKEEERKRECHKQALLKKTTRVIMDGCVYFGKITLPLEKKRIAICNAARQWDIQQNRATSVTASDQDNSGCASPSHKPAQLNGNTPYEFAGDKRSLDSVLSSAVQGLSVIDSHLVELEGDTLCLYGSGALESLDRTWSAQTSGSVSTFAFTFINFDDIVQVLPKLRIKFPNATHLKFKETNLITLQQFNALAQLRRLDQLTVEPQGNPVVNFTLWKFYVLFRLNNFNIQKINEVEVTQNDVVMSERLFGILAYVASSELPHHRLLALLGESRKKPFHPLLEGKCKKSLEETCEARRLGGETPSRAALHYIAQDLLNEKLEEIKEKKVFCHTYVQDLVKEAADINMKNESLQKLWPQMFIELVRDAVIEVRNKNSYMKQCLQMIVEQK